MVHVWDITSSGLLDSILNDVSLIIFTVLIGEVKYLKFTLLFVRRFMLLIILMSVLVARC